MGAGRTNAMALKSRNTHIRARAYAHVSINAPGYYRRLRHRTWDLQSATLNILVCHFA